MNIRGTLLEIGRTERGTKRQVKQGGRSSTGAVRGKNEDTDKSLSSCGYRVGEICFEGNQTFFLPECESSPFYSSKSPSIRDESY